MKNDTDFKVDTPAFNFSFDQGQLRYLKWGHQEIVRNLYLVVRDDVWESIFPVITAMDTEVSGDTFTLSFKASCKREGIWVDWDYHIQGTAEVLEFEIKGIAKTEFLSNRMGLCVHFPLQGYKGTPVTVTTPEGAVNTYKFPERIAPHQPFSEVSVLDWTVADVPCKMTFEGEIFECEDQRNWTDASFKVYGTPLSKPWPQRIHAGQVCHQKISLSVATAGLQRTAIEKPTLLLTAHKVVLPKIGLTANAAKLTPSEITALKGLNLAHIRLVVDLRTDKGIFNAQQEILQAKQLEVAVGLVLFLNAGDLPNPDLIATQLAQPFKLAWVLLFDAAQLVTELHFLKKVLPWARKVFPDTRIGGGTNHYFAELNRNPPWTDQLDFVSFSANPQVHAFDNRTLIENIASLADNAFSASALASGLPVHFSPLTLRPRFNPLASDGVKTELDYAQDPRQSTKLAALWTLATWHQLAKGAVQSVTYFQTVGDLGVLQTTDNKLDAFPVHEALSRLGSFKEGEITIANSSHPLQFDGFLFKQGADWALVLINFTSSALTIQVGAKPYTIPGLTFKTFPYLEGVPTT